MKRTKIKKKRPEFKKNYSRSDERKVTKDIFKVSLVRHRSNDGKFTNSDE